MTDWIRLSCASCSGYGWYLGWENCEVYCTDCKGGGTIYISSSDRIAEYPGGRFLGSWPGKYAKETQ